MNRELLRKLQAFRTEKRPCALVTRLSTGAAVLIDGASGSGDLFLTDEQFVSVRARIRAGQSGMIDDSLFARVYAPPLRMIIIGAVHVAAALAPIAVLTGLDVSVVDPREAFARSEQMAGLTPVAAWPDEALAQLRPDSRTAVVTLTHDPKLDDPALAGALRSSAFYIGALGSHKTHAKRVERLKEAGFTDADIARIHGPVGLDINALTPAEIAVSIMAQVIEVLRASAP